MSDVSECRDSKLAEKRMILEFQSSSVLQKYLVLNNNSVNHSIRWRNFIHQNNKQ